MGDAPPRRFLIQMSGYPGAGKSTVAANLSRRIPALVVDHDVIKSGILESGCDWGLASKLTYGVGKAMAEYYLQNGHSVLLDSACFYPEIIISGKALAEKYNAEYWYVECKVDDNGALENRLQMRVSHRSQRTSMNQLPSDAGENVVKGDARALFSKEPARPDQNYIVVDSSSTEETVLDEVMKRIGLEA